MFHRARATVAAVGVGAPQAPAWLRARTNCSASCPVSMSSALRPDRMWKKALPDLAPYLDHVRDTANGYQSVTFPVEDGLEISCRL
ncbi:hypothetical protein ACIRD8_22305 [Streptomyces sp. NPDC102451]|uniref:hypothetical protein n=1 Tax=Streptomyces sp. NPDC102451 TaxID=3366177 RepID=UPI003830BF44